MPSSQHTPGRTSRRPLTRIHRQGYRQVRSRARLAAAQAIRTSGRSGGSIPERPAELRRHVLKVAPMLLLDADSHYYEPGDCCTRYIEPKFRERTARIVKTDQG